MINQHITDKELEMFAAEPVNNLAFVPNHAMAQKMARELLARRHAEQSMDHQANIITQLGVENEQMKCRP